MTNLTLNGAANLQVTQLGDRSATLGGYGEEVVSVIGFFLFTAAFAYRCRQRVRTRLSHRVLSQSQCIVAGGAGRWDHGPVAGALGASGVQPNNGAALQLYNPIAQWLNEAAP